MNRRTFLMSSGVRLALAADTGSPVDFRYAPRNRQATFCFPDDPHKSLVGEAGDLRYGHTRGKSADYFRAVVQFSLRGPDPDRLGPQRLEAPGVPIVHTRIDRPEAFLELTTFATNRAGEGRIDNVILEVRPKSRRLVLAGPLLRVRTRGNLVAKDEAGVGRAFLDNTPFIVADRPLRAIDVGDGYFLTLPNEPARADQPLRTFLRFPQEGQANIAPSDADGLLAEARAWWREWSAFGGGVGWRLPGVYGDFLVACARNILQAREHRGGRLTFQVGPTVYRGLWVVDGNFILEAARYLGYDAEAQQGLETTWAMQDADGGIFAGGGKQHWQDTGIAMFTLVRQAELSQDWSYFRKMQPEVLKGAQFLAAMREKGRAEGSANGRYGLLARGFGDGGIGGGVRDEFTNTIWALAGLKAVAGAAERQNLGGFEPVRALYRDLNAAFRRAAREQMMRHAGGFEFLPMILREDKGWTNPDPWMRWRPQTGQWALAQTIYPGLLFDRDDPIVKGYVALMQSCTQEEVPIETGWIPHDGLWNYDAGFAAHVYLWAGLEDWALETFHGFLNHATPLYCWREEQPLKGALVGGTFGDMPHNWASAECVLFLRHMMALEDGAALRLLPGIGEAQLASGQPLTLRQSPTRFGRIDMALEPVSGGWRLSFARGRGPAPAAVRLPPVLAGRFRLSAPVDLAASSWTATWRP